MPDPSGPLPWKYQVATISLETKNGPTLISVELAVTLDQLTKGLTHREILPPFTGMLFVFERDRQITMWMKDTKLSLDMIFISSTGVVLRIEPNVEPFSEAITSSIQLARAVLEIEGGSAERLSIETGARVTLHGFTFDSLSSK